MPEIPVFPSDHAKQLLSQKLQNDTELIQKLKDAVTADLFGDNPAALHNIKAALAEGPAHED